MSLAEGAIVMGMAGMAALGAASLSGNLNDATKRAEGLVARSQFTASLSNYLSNAVSCDDLKDAKPSGYSATPESITFTKWKFNDFSEITGGTVGKKKITPFKSFTLEELTGYIIKDSASPKIPTVSPAGVKEDLSKGTLTIQLDIGISDRSYKHIYNIPVLATDSGVIRYCGDDRSVAESCATMKGVFNPNGDPDNGYCDLADGCRLSGSYSRLTCSGGPCSTAMGTSLPNPFTNDYTCPTGSTEVTTQSTNWSNKVDCGKKCTANVTNNMVWVSCMSCPTPP
jgi:hypothetical protein